MPTRLPLSCLTMAPRFDARLNSSIIAVRRPLGEVNRETKTPLIGIGEGLQGAKDEDHNPPNLNPTPEAADVYTVGPPPEKLLRDLQHQLHRLFAAKPADKIPMMMGKFVKFNTWGCRNNILRMIHRRSRRSCGCSDGVDLKVGRLFRQVWLRLSAERRHYRSHFQRSDQAFTVGGWKVSSRVRFDIRNVLTCYCFESEPFNM